MNHQDQKPVDMNEVFRGIAQENFNANAGNIIANTLIASGNALRAQGYGMMSNVDAAQLLTVPALLSNGSSLALLPFFRPNQGFFRLIVSHAADGQRVFCAFLEDETNTMKTRFLEPDAEMLAELNRQLNALNMENKGHAELGLMLIEKPVEGYQYFAAPESAPEETAPEVPAAPVDATPAPKELSEVVGDVAPV